MHSSSSLGATAAWVHFLFKMGHHTKKYKTVEFILLSLYNFYLIWRGVLETRNKMPVTIRAYWLFHVQTILTEQTLINLNLQQTRDNMSNVGRKKDRK